MDCSLQKSGEHSADQPTAGENGSPFSQLLFFVPAAEDVVAPDKCRCLKDGLKEANDHDLPWTVDEPGPKSQQAPGDDAAGKINARRELLQREVIGDLAEHVTAIEDCKCVSIKSTPSHISWALLVLI